MKKNKKFLLLIVLLIQPGSGFAAGLNDMFGFWGSLILQGDLKTLSPGLSQIKWLVMNQTRTRDDSTDGSRFSENLLFGQLGYQINNNASVWLGYNHTWADPLNKRASQESRPYADFVWQQSFYDFKLLTRARIEDRIHLTTGNTGYRGRELVQISHPLPFLKGLRIYLGDEVLFYADKNNFGKRGFSENRVLSGLSYQLNDQMGVDLGYLGQYVDNVSGNNLFTHNLQFNLHYRF